MANSRLPNLSEIFSADFGFKIALPIIICSGVIKAMVHYYYFGIPILQYLEMSEATILFVDDLPFLLVIILFMTCVEIFETKPSILVSVQRHKGIYVILILGALGFVFIPTANIDHSSKTIILVLAGSILFFEEGRQQNNRIKRLYAIVYLFVFLIYCGLNEFETVVRLKRDSPYFGSKFFFTDGGRMEVTDSVIFVGKSKNYFYLYDIPTRSPIIVNGSNVTSFQIKYSRITDGGQRWYKP
jgi:hypothetical protein